jgi:hypothetical protein
MITKWEAYDSIGFFYLKVTRFPKTFIKIMANVKLLFCGSEKSETDSISVECFYNGHKEITIRIDEGENSKIALVSLDKETAIKFCKELRKSIALID